MTRPDRDTFWFGLAAQYATRATCPRAAIGAVLVKFDRLIGAGFNGAPEGEPHCLEIEGATLELHLAIDHCHNARHAEINALRNALLPPFGATLYVVGQRDVCINCKARLREAGVTDIRWQPSVLSLDALARDIWPWARTTFPHATAQSWAKHLLKEAGELDERPTSGEEMADIFHLLAGIAGVTGTDLTAEVARKFAVNRARTWGEPDEHGVVEHIREAVR